MDKKLNYSIHSCKKHRQYESNNAATKHSLCPLNGVFGHDKMHHICNCVRFCFNNNKNSTLKSTKNIKKNKNNIKTF